MIAASLLSGAVLRIVTGSATTWAVVLGTLGPLCAAAGTWFVVARTHARSPARVPGVMIKLFGVKLVFFAGYVAAAVLLLEETTAFVVTFACQYVVLHLMQAFHLRRMLAGA